MKTNEQLMMEMMGQPEKPQRSLAGRFCVLVLKVAGGALLGVVLIFAVIYFGAGLKDRMDVSRADERSGAVAKAIAEKQPLIGMTVGEAEAALGKLRFDSSVGSEKGRVDIYVRSGYGSSLTLYFGNGQLKRWIYEKAP